MESIINKIDSFFDDYFEKQNNLKEERKHIKFLKKYCKKNFLKNSKYEEYELLVKKIFEEINTRNKDDYKNNSFEASLVIEQIKNRLYELAKEFMDTINKNYFRTEIALTRELI
jgi:hypothetical protein